MKACPWWSRTFSSCFYASVMKLNCWAPREGSPRESNASSHQELVIASTNPCLINYKLIVLSHHYYYSYFKYETLHCSSWSPQECIPAESVMPQRLVCVCQYQLSPWCIQVWLSSPSVIKAVVNSLCPLCWQFIIHQEPEVFSLDDGLRNAIKLRSPHREVLAATFHRFVQRNIGLQISCYSFKNTLCDA